MAAQVAALAQTLNLLRAGSREAERAQASAQVQAAEAEAGRAQAQYARLQKAGGGAQAVSKLDVENARWQVAAAQARVAAAKAALSLLQEGARAEEIARAEAQLRAGEAEVALLRHYVEETVLRAPADALVRARLAEPGDMAVSGRAVYTLALVETKWVRAYVNAGQLGWVREGMPAQVFADSFPEAPLAGKVGYIASVAEFTPKTVQTPELRTSLVYEIRVRVQDGENRLRLGMPVTVRLDEAQ